jgi:hypothetical protein
VPENPEGLSPRELLFVAAYCGPANFNATDAYAMAGYRRSTANACRLIARERIAQAIARKVAERTQRLQAMAGNEALERLTRVGRSTIREFLPPGHYLRALPDEVLMLVKSVRPTKYGDVIEVHDAMRAVELLAKAAGKLKDVHEVRAKTLEDLIAEANQLEAAEAEAEP